MGVHAKPPQRPIGFDIGRLINLVMSPPSILAAITVYGTNIITGRAADRS
jgi:hypothetical protein